MYLRLFWIVILLLPFSGCLPRRDLNLAQKASESGDWDEAHRLWSELLKKYPADPGLKLSQERARNNAALQHLRKASTYFERDKLAESAFEVGMVLNYDPDNQEALNMGAMIKEAQETMVAEQDRTQRELDEVPLSNLPTLNPTTWDPLNLTFTNQSTRDIYISLGKAYGLNIVVDPKLRDEKLSIDLKSLSFLKALDTLMILNRHFFKIIDDNTLIILEDNKNNREQYNNQIIQTFYLSNSTPKDIKAHLRQLGGIKEFAENEKLNAITIKGTAEEVALAHKIIDDNDKAAAEVVVEIELLEANKSSMRKVGLLPVDTQGNSLFRAGIYADPSSRSNSDRDRGGIRGIFPSLSNSDFLTIVPALAIDFLKEKGGSKQVANPQLRVTSGETGTVTIGQSIPIAQTSFTNPQLSGSAAGNNSFGDSALTTFNYNDVGIKIIVKPRVHYNNEITLDLELEVSSVISGGPQPTLGKRNVKTVIRLRNGETNVMAGLLTNDERKSLLGIAGLSDIPVLGRLFSNDEKVVSQTDIILTTRPVIIRGPNISKRDRAPYELSSLSLSSLYDPAKIEQMRGKSTQPEGAETEPSAAPAGSTKKGHEAVEAIETPEAEPSAPDATTPPEPDTTDPTVNEPPESAEPAGKEAEAEEEEPIPAMLAFTPPNQEARADQEIEYQLFVTNVEGMRRGEIVISYNPEVLQAVNIELGDFFGGQYSKPLLTPAWDNAKGLLTIILTQPLGSEPFSGSGILTNLRFLAKGPGRGELAFRTIQMTNAEDKPIEVEGLTGSYEVAP